MRKAVLCSSSREPPKDNIRGSRTRQLAAAQSYESVSKLSHLSSTDNGDRVTAKAHFGVLHAPSDLNLGEIIIAQSRQRAANASG
jgi:hypothetical protein